MSELATLARPYAAAVFKRAKETGTVVQWSETLAFLGQLMAGRDVKSAASNPKLGRHGFATLLIELCQQGIDNEGKNLIRLLADNGKLALAGQIAVLYEQYLASEQGFLTARVLSAYPLNETEKKQLGKALQKALGKRVRLEATVDRSLIGGVVIRVGDKVIDGSIKGQLQRLAKRLDS